MQALRTMLDAAYDEGFTDDDWSHALGGIHVWAAGAAGILAHGSLVERQLHSAGRSFQVGYVEAVATDSRFRRQGHGTAVMRRICDLIHARYEFGALSTGEHAFYEPLGWERWQGATWVNSPNGRQRTPEEDDSIMVLRTLRSPSLILASDLVADWRDGDVW